eukprot:365680-Chlamydomonas_euryale.AAC.3
MVDESTYMAPGSLDAVLAVRSATADSLRAGSGMANKRRSARLAWASICVGRHVGSQVGRQGGRTASGNRREKARTFPHFNAHT